MTESAALQPDERMRSIVSSTGESDSMWNVITSAPAFTKSGIYLSGSLIIR